MQGVFGYAASGECGENGVGRSFPIWQIRKVSLPLGGGNVEGKCEMRANGVEGFQPVYEVKGTPETPAIRLDAARGRLEIEGSSMPENPQAFYAPVLEWLQGYVKHPASRTSLIFSMKYYNTSTSKILLQVLSLMESLFRSGAEVEVCWKYDLEDEDMEECGYEYAESTVVPFRMQPER